MTAPYACVALVDHTGKIDPGEVRAVAVALQVQVSRDFALPPPYGWGVNCLVRATQHALPHEWQLGLFSDADQPGALGYHDETKSGMPLAKVFPFLDPGQPWSVTASHELLEMLADPLLCRAAQDHNGRFWALECADAVEQDTYAIEGVTVSDFVLPTYFEPPSKISTKLDHLGLVKQPYEIRPGGYGQWFDPATGWQQVLADKKSGYRAALADSGRTYRRRRRVRP